MLLTYPDIPPCITAGTSIITLRLQKLTLAIAISEGHGDTALLLLKSGAETDKKDVDGHLAIEIAPDKKVRALVDAQGLESDKKQIRDFLLQSAEYEGISLL